MLSFWVRFDGHLVWHLETTIFVWKLWLGQPAKVERISPRPDHYPGKLCKMPRAWSNSWYWVWLPGKRDKQLSLPMYYIMDSTFLFLVVERITFDIRSLTTPQPWKPWTVQTHLISTITDHTRNHLDHRYKMVLPPYYVCWSPTCYFVSWI